MSNKQNWISSIIRLFFCIFLLIYTALHTTLSMYASAAEAKDPLIYIALGDSISTGYGLKGYKPGTVPKNSYTALIKKDLEQKYETQRKIIYANWGKDGRDSTGLLQQLNELSGSEKTLLSQAEIITISIGSNDLLLPFLDILKNNFTTLKKNLVQNETLLSACEKWSGDNGTFHAIIQQLKEMAPHAELYVNTIYNPFEKVRLTSTRLGQHVTIFDLGMTAEPYISSMNAAFSADSEDYTLIRLDQEFKAPGLTNVNVNWRDLNNLNFDPHPNALGHSVIAECVLRKMKD